MSAVVGLDTFAEVRRLIARAEMYERRAKETRAAGWPGKADDYSDRAETARNRAAALDHATYWSIVHPGEPRPPA